ncbi:molybdate ABC transporter substrate-binding protein [Methanococcus aeolicus]|uniref:Molybdenum ABC transporter, periplasmic molybdate-binding protein n=1 Tax=Methanococcus aeolicus (strain ATCC BAA-1280 / DSM 17508 / OCM 812 / Nankai-3) TaxID=419665 RepID=A6UTR5_META3|nr:molybdate ABC transporter substrate-binding protein [Methanococcus aeolicus]ABR55887.1 molybdenum ABC transporter, periplasmic molybdate-binding protein [Methanococcus aeolicus Nankai-3]UXM84008.1 molybdate ABC transporter substrate-binding protein [Methanococcus aeolicus]
MNNIKLSIILSTLLLSSSIIFSGCIDSPQTIKIDKFEDLGNKGVSISIGNPEHVPAGKYAMKILDNLKKSNPEFADNITKNIVSKEVNVRAVLDKVVSKEVDAGFVYRTDAFMEKDKLNIIKIPDDVSVTPEYPISVLKDSDNKKSSEEFVKFILSKDGQDILSKYGFISPVENPKPYEVSGINDEIVVYAAASLTDAFNEIADEFEKKTGCNVKLSFASSGSLRQKIEGGAVGGTNGADVFASASLKHMDILKNEEFIGNYSIFAKNEMVVITPK